MSTTTSSGGRSFTVGERIAAHVSIARFDHWVKNVFVLPGFVVAWSVTPNVTFRSIFADLLLGMLAVGLVASSNYVLNEILDAPYDREHPRKRDRPAASGRVSIPLGYAQWLAMGVAGVALSWWIAEPLALANGALWVMGVIYNVPPIRTKELPYVDVMSEAINNPLRMLAGWYIVRTAAAPPASLLGAYWMIGCYFMALKRFAEYRDIADKTTSVAYRRSFRYYDDVRLLVSTMFYASLGMLLFGAFIVRYRLELILAFPLVAVVMAIYQRISFQPNSAAQRPEGLFRERDLMISVCACAVWMTVLLFVDIPILGEIFAPLPSGLQPQR